MGNGYSFLLFMFYLLKIQALPPKEMYIKNLCHSLVEEEGEGGERGGVGREEEGREGRRGGG